MSAEHLTALHAAGAFEPFRQWEELPIDHVPYSTLAGEDVEGRLAAAVTSDVRVVCVIGPTGAGKSSLLATVARDLPERHPLLRIGVGVLDDDVADSVAFSLHIVRRVRDIIDDQLRRKERSTLDEATATTWRSQRRGGSVRVEGGVNLGIFTGKLGAELKSAVEAIERERQPADAIKSLEELVRVFDGHDLRPILAIDDTDLWLGRDHRGRELAHRFFSGPVRLLAKELPISVVIAVHPEYREVDGYRDLAGLSSELRLPDFPRPREAISEILAHRIRASEISDGLNEVFSGEAIVRLEAEYDRKPRDLRHVLTITNHALHLCGPPFPERLEAQHIRAAAQDL